MKMKNFENNFKRFSSQILSKKVNQRNKIDFKQIEDLEERFHLTQQQYNEEIHTDTTAVKQKKSKSQNLPVNKIAQHNIDVGKIVKQTISQKSNSNPKQSKNSSIAGNRVRKLDNEFIQVNMVTESHAQLRWNKNFLAKKRQTLSTQKFRRQWDDKRVPYSNEFVLDNFGNLLTNYEKKQIKQYKKIYYIGQRANFEQKKLLSQNQKFDNEEKQLILMENDHIAYRFEILKLIDTGSYGQVVRVFDHLKKSQMALKIIKNRTKFTKQAFTEIKILTHIKQNDRDSQSNLIRIKDFVIFRKHVCMLFDLMSNNLYDLIARNNHNGLNLDLIRIFAIQLLNSLIFLHQNKIIHCDLKPQNILMKEPNKSAITIIDFGSSCFQNQTVYTYIQSRYYRAPEITLGVKYDLKIDMWSLGCILAELYTGVPLFPGQNQQEQMKHIVSTLGVPPKQILKSGKRVEKFFDQNQDLHESIKKMKTIGYFGQKLSQRIHEEKFKSFIEQFLQWDPKDRKTPIEAIKHPWIVQGVPKDIRISDLIQASNCRGSSPEFRVRRKKKAKSKSKSKSKQKKIKLKMNITKFYKVQPYIS